MGIEEVLLGARGIELPDPVAQAKAGLSLADLSAQNQIRQYALQTAQRQDKARQVLGQVLPALQQAGWTDEAIQTAIRHPLVQQNPEVIQDVLKEADAQRKSQLEAGRTKAQTLKDTTEAKAKAFNDIGGAAFAAQKNPDAMALSRVNAMAKFYGVELPPFSGDPQNPQHVTAYLQGLGNASIAAKDQLTAAETGRHNVATEGLTNQQRAEQAQHNRATEAVQRGQLGVSQARLGLERENAGKPSIQADVEGNLWNVDRRGVATPITKPSGEPLVKGGKLTEDQGKSTGFAMRMRDARRVIDQLEAEGSVDPTGMLVAHAGKTGWVGTPANWAVGKMNPKAQVYEQAKRNWVTANLRPESGAAIPPEELDQEMRKWFPIQGESQESVDSKRAAREVVERAMIIRSGPGAKNVPEPVAPTPSSKPGAKAGKFSAVTPTGVTVYFDSEAAMNATKMKWEQIDRGR